MKYKVGDMVRIVDNTTDHGFEIDDVVVIVRVSREDYKAFKDGEFWFVVYSEIEPVKAKLRLKVGKTYTAKNGHKYTCIAVNDTHAWLNLSAANTGTAYVWNIDGKATLGDDWDIDLGPKVETITVKGSIHQIEGEWISFHSDIGDHKFNLEVTTLDGIPDWSTAKVTPCD